jgi:hypothetical protein
MIIRSAILPVMLAAPVLAQEPVSEAGTAFMHHCLADVTESRVMQLKEKAPDFAATMSDDQLAEGARQKAIRVCPCFLHVIGVSPVSEGATPEDKVAGIVAYLDAIHAGEEAEMPPVLSTITKNCGERSSVMPVRWLGQ